MELAAALLTCLVFYAVYYSRLGLDRSLVAILEAVLAGAVIALGLLLLAPHSDDFLEDLNPMSQGFLLAALPEKLLGLLALLYMTIRDRNEMSVKNSIGYGVLIGAGFSFVENIAYAWIFGSQIVYLRLFSSVSMHLTSMGLMGYLLGMGYLRNRKRWIFFLLCSSLPAARIVRLQYSVRCGMELHSSGPHNPACIPGGSSHFPIPDSTQSRPASRARPVVRRVGPSG